MLNIIYNLISPLLNLNIVNIMNIPVKIQNVISSMYVIKSVVLNVLLIEVALHLKDVNSSFVC